MKFLKKHVKLIVLIGTVLSIYFIYTMNDDENVVYTALGDSFALGENCYGEIGYGYSDYLADNLKQEDRLNYYTKTFSEKNLSIRNLKEKIITNQKIKVGKREFNLKHTLRDSSILTLSIGLNDLIYKLSLEENLTDSNIKQIVIDTSKDFKGLIKEIKKYYPYKIYVVGYYITENMSKGLKKAILELNEKYQQNEEIIFVDTSHLFENRKDFLENPNNIHPNTLGYQAIYEEIRLKMLKKELI